jgi:hypothetical protein
MNDSQIAKLIILHLIYLTDSARSQYFSLKINELCCYLNYFYWCRYKEMM